MAEGGEGEDEIQFLRTVSKHNFIGGNAHQPFKLEYRGSFYFNFLLNTLSARNAALRLHDC